jgi:hypothetical protein
MSREVLLTLLGTLLVVNVGVLISIGFLSRRARARGTQAAHIDPVPRAEAVVKAFEASTPDARAAVTSVEHAERHVRAEPVVDSPPVLSARALASAPVVPALPAESRVVSPIGVAVIDREPEEAVAGNGHVDHGDALEAVEHHPNAIGAESATIQRVAVSQSRNGAPSTKPGGKGRRSRRFVLPPLQEDDGRSARAIEAFLGEASISPPVAHPERTHRRRHRARRAHGTKTARTSLVVDLVGYEQLAAAAGDAQAARLAGALAETLWRSARIGDEVRELAPGQIQLMLDCDAAGADAFAKRAAATVAPWLGAMPAPVQARIAQAPVEDSPSAGSAPTTVRP